MTTGAQRSPWTRRLSAAFENDLASDQRDGGALVDAGGNTVHTGRGISRDVIERQGRVVDSDRRGIREGAEVGQDGRAACKERASAVSIVGIESLRVVAGSFETERAGEHRRQSFAPCYRRN